MEKPKLYVGIDLGSNTTVIASSSPLKPTAITLETNALSNRATPTSVGYGRFIRTIGESAEAELSSNAANIIKVLVQLLNVKNNQEFQNCKERFNYLLYQVPIYEENTVFFDVSLSHESHKITLEEVLATLLRQSIHTVLQNNGIITETNSNEYNIFSDIFITLAVSDLLPDENLSTIFKAASLAGLEDVNIVAQKDAAFQQWVAKNGADFMSLYGGGEEAVFASILDVGFVTTTFQVLKVTAEGIEPVTSGTESFGTYEFVARLANNFMQQIRAQGKISEFSPGSKPANKLFAATAKTMLDLSVLNDSWLDVEALHEGEDVRLKVTRAQFDDLCASYKTALIELMTRVLGEAKCGTKLKSVDFIGGGSRIPWVQNTTNEVLFSQDNTKCDVEGPPRLRFTLDGTAAIACGSVLLRVTDTAPGNCTKHSYTDRSLHNASEESINREKRFRCVETTEISRQAIWNQFENALLQTRSQISRPEYASKVDVALVNSIIDEAEEWLFDEDRNYPRPAEETSARHNKFQQDISEPLKELYSILKEEAAKREAEITAKAAETAANREDDPDVQLPPSQNLRRAAKNKDEGIDLFNGGSIELAAARFQRALQFCAKIEPGEFKTESDQIALACNLNLAECFMKIGGEVAVKKAVNACDAVLALEPKNSKALYRKAQALEYMKDYETALKILKQCEDKEANVEIQKLIETVTKAKKNEQQKSKKMFAKMFG